MALNLYRKINETIARNCTRFLQNNARKLAQNILEDSAKVQKDVENAKKFDKFAISSLQRTTPVENPRLWSSPFEPEREIMHRNLQNQYLQPATLPSYRDKPIFDTNFMATLQEGPIRKAQTIAMNNSASQQILEAFKKRKAQNLPTRVPKLTSNPFPEPLKAIFSPYTVSDQEKAEQMFLDQKAMGMNRVDSTATSDLTPMKSSKKFYSTASGTNQGSIVRFFSKKSGGKDVCEDKSKPKAKSCLQKKCNKITIKGCPPVRPNTICKQKNVEVHCKKIEAPYPSFSESCYMEPRTRKTECDLCPWNERTNPHFKGKFKRPGKEKFYHTACFPSSPQNSSGGILVRSFESQTDNKNSAQLWIQKANLSQIYSRGKKLPTMDFFDSWRDPKPNRWPFGVAKRSKIVEKKVQNPIMPETVKFGYCDRHRTILTEFFMKNNDLLQNFKNGDDLSDFGVKKTKLSKILSSKEVFEVLCKKGERIIPDYPRNCDRPYQDTTKKCPSGLTRKKTKKDRLKRKIPKEQSCS